MSALAKKIWTQLLVVGLLGIAVVVALFTAAPSAHAQQLLPVTLLPSAARTAASVNTPDQTNCCWHGIYVIINTSAFTAGTYTPTIQGKDPVSGTYYTILTGAAINGTGLVVLKVLPGITAATNVAVLDALPRTWRLSLAGSSASMTFSVGAYLIP